MIYPPHTIECSSTAELRQLRYDEITDDTLFLVSEPGHLSTDTDLGSRFLSYRELTTMISNDFINDGVKFPKSEYYIGDDKSLLTSIHVVNGIVSAVNDYRPKK